jgi:hypothetical protein
MLAAGRPDRAGEQQCGEQNAGEPEEGHAQRAGMPVVTRTGGGHGTEARVVTMPGVGHRCTARHGPWS